MASVWATKSNSNPNTHHHVLFFTLIELIRSGPALANMENEEKQGYIHMLAEHASMQTCKCCPIYRVEHTNPINQRHFKSQA